MKISLLFLPKSPQPRWLLLPRLRLSRRPEALWMMMVSKLSVHLRKPKVMVRDAEDAVAEEAEADVEVPVPKVVIAPRLKVVVRENLRKIVVLLLALNVVLKDISPETALTKKLKPLMKLPAVVDALKELAALVEAVDRELKDMVMVKRM